MCSRYYIDEDLSGGIYELLARTPSDVCLTARDVYPGELAPVLTGDKTGLSWASMRWGFPQYTGKGLLINARSETALQKRTFSESVLHRRCVIPARRFYEWDDSRNKVSFSQEDGTALFMAGFFNLIQDELRFVILTTEANASVRQVHERMPLILEKDDIEKWIYDPMETQRFLKKLPLPLERFQEYEQQSLFAYNSVEVPYDTKF